MKRIKTSFSVITILFLKRNSCVWSLNYRAYPKIPDKNIAKLNFFNRTGEFWHIVM